MKRIIFRIGVGLIFLFCFAFLGMYIWIGQSVKKNIKVAKTEYAGTAEDALIAMLNDANKPAAIRTHKAIWTLAQLRSEKALPLLKSLYINDPKGETCYGKHDSLLCQYEIYKAIEAIEKDWWFSHAHLNK